MASRKSTTISNIVMDDQGSEDQAQIQFIDTHSHRSNSPSDNKHTAHSPLHSDDENADNFNLNSSNNSNNNKKISINPERNDRKQKQR